MSRDNSRLKGVLPKDYARPGLDTLATLRDTLLPKLLSGELTIHEYITTTGGTPRCQ